MVQLGRTAENMARDVCADIARPALRGVEGHHAQGMSILAGQHIGDDGLQVGLSASVSRYASLR